ncbi:g-protein coupled receptor 98 [Trichonephila clavipes]|nr:g-protein coupled receptor 98 [Trichonephila clavipes]
MLSTGGLCSCKFWSYGSLVQIRAYLFGGPDNFFFSHFHALSSTSELRLKFQVSSSTQRKSTPGILEFEKPSYAVVENETPLEIAVLRKGGSDGTIQVDFNIISLTAKPGEDYTPVKGRLIFEPGQTRKTIHVPIINDNVKEIPETFKVQLFDPSAGSEVFHFRGLGTRNSCLVTITDDDIIQLNTSTQVHLLSSISSVAVAPSFNTSSANSLNQCFSNFQYLRPNIQS